MIYQGLVKLIRNKPFDQISILELTNASGVGRTTFYRNFDHLDDVLRMKCAETLTAFFNHLLQYAKTQALKGSIPFTQPFFEFWYADASLIEVLIQANRMDIFKQTFLDLAKTFDVKFPSYPDPELDPYLQEIKFALSITLLTQWVQQGKNIHPRRLVEALNHSLNSQDQALIRT